ncbi:hypothetical protein CsSME_00032022 [Camellia sinensis var. sinensis]
MRDQFVPIIGYTCIPTTYANFGAAINPKLHDSYHKALDEILELATNDDGKHKVIQLGLREIKDRVKTIASGTASNMPCTSTVPPSTSIVPPSHSSPKSPPRMNTTKASNTRKVLSPLVAHRRGRPCTKQKVSKVDEIVNRLKRKNKKTTPTQVPQDQAYYVLSMVGTQDSMYVPVPHDQAYYFPSMVGIQDNMFVPARVCTMKTPDNIGSTSGMVNNISSQSSTAPTILDPNAPFLFLVLH